MSDSYVTALLVEREGYARRGLANRVAQVDAELARFGIAAERPVEAAIDVLPKERRGRGRASS